MEGQSNEEIQKIFEDFQEQMQKIEPILFQQIETINDNKIALESYQSYLEILNQTPSLSLSNRASL